jgi:phosphoribosylformylglycinamidine (FGAM) synthase-like enzyme
VAAINGVHDVSDGGVAVAMAEMALASQVGFRADLGADPSATALFGEAPSRVVFSVDAATVVEFIARAVASGLTAEVMGVAGGDRLVVEGALDVALEAATAAWRDALPGALALVAGGAAS